MGWTSSPPFDPPLYRRLVEFLADSRWKTGDDTYEPVQVERLQAAPVWDLLAHVDRLVERARRGVTQRLAQQLVAVFLHLEERWSELREQPVEDEACTLREALQGRAWLPAERSGSSLHRWPAAVKPEDRLFRADELYHVGDANLVASQAPVFAASRVIASLRKDLGFVTKPRLETVLAHFDAVIEYWTKGGARMKPERFSGALDDIYKFLAGFQGTLDAEVIGARYAGRPCLWHDGDFWPPERAFRAKVSFFGGRRVQVLVRPPIRHAYHMLGLRDKPVAEDFLAHLAELEAEAGGNPLPPREVLHVLQLYPHLVGLLGTAAPDTRFPLLTQEGRFVDAEVGFLPDAPWYADRVTPGTISLLHSDLSPEVKTLPWVRSLARDMSERSTGNWTATADDRTKERIATFQSLIRTEPFRLGVARLVWNESGRHRASEVGWLARSNVVGVDSFESELVVTVRGEELLVGQGPSTQYFDANTKTFFVMVTLPSVVRQRLAQALNESLGEAKLRNAAPLLAILECEPTHPRRGWRPRSRERVRRLEPAAGLTAATAPARDEPVP